MGEAEIQAEIRMGAVYPAVLPPNEVLGVPYFGTVPSQLQGLQNDCSSRGKGRRKKDPKLTLTRQYSAIGTGIGTDAGFLYLLVYLPQPPVVPSDQEEDNTAISSPKAPPWTV